MQMNSEIFLCIRYALVAVVISLAAASEAAWAEQLSRRSQVAEVSSDTSHSDLNLSSLELRLRSTQSIGLFTKLELKSEFGDLVDTARAYHDGTGVDTKITLVERFDDLLAEVLDLVQDGDGTLYSLLNNSRPGLLKTLTDREQFKAAFEAR